MLFLQIDVKSAGVLAAWGGVEGTDLEHGELFLFLVHGSGKFRIKNKPHRDIGEVCYVPKKSRRMLHSPRI